MDSPVWALLGASRGLGRAFFEAARGRKPEIHFLLAARKKDLLLDLASSAPGRVRVYPADLSQPQERAALWDHLIGDVQPQRIFYFAGGGPYGPFTSKQIKDHRWAVETTFLGAMEAIHASLSKCDRLEQIVLVGSSVAEDRADPMASSYSASKHALLGLTKSLWEEPLGGVDLRLFSPGYMDTALLPPGATARQQPLAAPTDVAEKLLDWCLDPDGPRHYK